MRGIIFSVKHTGRLPLSLTGRAVEGHMPCRRLTLLWAVPTLQCGGGTAPAEDGGTPHCYLPSVPGSLC